jgi:putative nucleotidyltransferase with HDIG domain
MRLFRSLFVWMLLASALPLAVFAAAFLWAIGSHPSDPPLGPLLRAAAVSGAVTLALAAAFAAVAARGLARPVREVVTGALEIARGHFGHQVRVEVRNEVGELAYTFNHMSRELASYDAENRRLIGELEAGWLATTRSLVSAIDAKDPHTRGHSQRVAELAVAVGRELGLGAAELEALERGGLLHDVGKIGVPEAILGKRDALTAEERATMREHPAIGAAILCDAEFLRAAMPAVRSHHEWYDGRGYPDGLAGDEIPLVARIVAAADTFDACTSDRPYQPAMTRDEALEVLARLRGAQLDPRVHEALVRVVRAGPERGSGAARRTA